MKGDKSEGKNHEYYVTASYHGKIQKASKVNVDVANPDYKKDSQKSQPKASAKKPEQKKTTPQPQKPQPRQDTYKKPLPNNKPTTGKNNQSDKDGRIIDVSFKNRAGEKFTTTPKFGETIIVEIQTKNVIGKHYYLRVWEDDTIGEHDLLYEGTHKITNDKQLVTFALTKDRQQIGEIGNDPKDPDSGEYRAEWTDHQELFAEIAFADISKESTRLTIEVLEEYKSPEYKSTAKVKKLPKQEPKKGECFYNRKFEDKEVANIIKQLRILTGHKDTVNLWYKQTTPKMDDKSLAGFVKELNANFNHYNIKTCSQKMHFLAHACIETGAFSKAREGGTDLSYDPWRGHGLLQLTKEVAYEKYNAKENKNLVAKPEKIAENLHLTVDSGCWTWSEFKKMPSDVESKAVKRWGKVTAGKSLNQLALYGDKYLELISALLNGRNDKTDMPNGWEERKTAYEYLRNFIFKYDWFHGGKKEEPVNTKDIVTYHIYSGGDIEKHIPKVIKSGFEKKYKYVYHDTSDKEYIVCTVEWNKTDGKKTGVNQGNVKPTHSKIIYDKIVNEGQTERRVIYENGDVAEHGSNKGKTFWNLYKSEGKKIELVRMPDSLDIAIPNSRIKYNFSDTQRRYTCPGALAGFIGALAECGFTDILTTGSCFKYATCFPSVKHVNGQSIDTKYINRAREEKFVKAMSKFHFNKQITGNDTTHTYPGTAHQGDHNDHLHSGFDESQVKIKKG
ncbi:hypothetical protein NZ698_16370 [Chryseobacterium sp. PBS4-4]|uniref:Glycoside hydrolase family 19 catalytic domain-containing protein n=1 Tax=Chryseobacterium edaphi TaxID=2976532 RepID=A0ABT2W978_9FLAO|nr:hypothetical protein [Chryseobacterium edaphi]MCU7618771.1 hypothetical protein [Chryseobacterium edaphi]